ncbi:MAG: VWA domain-containing protein [Bryobacterales bacterium]|nr:VWA domain-containing protein [Bryobacterales bacterium]
MRFFLFLAALISAANTLSPSTPPSAGRGETTGSLIRTDPYGKHTGELCPLRRTDVQGAITGSLARVDVTQEFVNNSPDTIEAVYTFPLPRLAAVDQMTMTIADRVIRAEIHRRADAQRLYDDARRNGQTAALLQQQRPNVFTQSVTNIAPGAKVLVRISYVETLKYDEGAYEFSFPMTVGPRYNDGGLNPKYAPPATRAGHDLSLRLTIDAGVPVRNITSSTHEILTSGNTVQFKQAAVVPNKDFILRYQVAGNALQDAVLTHRAARGGFFTLILQPPARVTAEDVSPKELIFVVDTSGSMSGFPMEKAKESMRMALAGLYPRDTFNLITFAGDTHVLFPRPVPATAENLRAAREFLDGRYGGGGTEMMKAVRAAFAPSGAENKTRIICFMTDGYVGNEAEIIAEVQRHPEARVFSFGIGSSVNRYLLDKMAEEGRGEVEYVALNDDGSAAARRFHERVRNPLLTDISVEWNGLPVSDVYPERIPDLFSAKPLILHGRYGAAAGGSITLRGRMSGKPFSKTISMQLPREQREHDVLATLWARARVEDLMHTNPQRHDEAQVTRLGLEFRLLTQYTAFVAIDTHKDPRTGQPVRIEVPAEMPEGVSHEGVFGAASAPASLARLAMPQVARRQNAIGMADVRAKEEVKVRDAARLVRTGTQMVDVEVWLTDVNPQILEMLKKAGFEPSPVAAKVGKIRLGRIRADRIAELEKLACVLTVRPAPAP